MGMFFSGVVFEALMKSKVKKLYCVSMNFL